MSATSFSAAPLSAPASHSPDAPHTGGGIPAFVARTDQTVFGRWWLTVDKLMLIALVTLIAIGAVMSLAASPAVAQRIDLAREFRFAMQHLTLLPVAALGMIITSLLPASILRRLAIVGFAAAVIMLVLVLFIGEERNGAHRWLSVAGFSLQPSEFAKPLFALTSAWLLAIGLRDGRFPARMITFGLFAVTALLFVLEPDLGQTLVLSGIWTAQLFIGGLALGWIILFALGGLGLVAVAYFTMGHVKNRIDSFLFPDANTDTYQIETSLNSFREGGMFGKGPGEGSIKNQLPDAHTDFVFAVIGEEFGLIVCFFVLLVVAFIALRAMSRTLHQADPFLALATVGLATQFTLQSFINMATALNLIPTKGMTLPFVSYGGSSLLATALAMGLILALTRHGARSGLPGGSGYTAS